MANPEQPSGGLLPEAGSPNSAQHVYGYESAQAAYPGQRRYQQSASEEEAKRLEDQQQQQQQQQHQQQQQQQQHWEKQQHQEEKQQQPSPLPPKLPLKQRETQHLPPPPEQPHQSHEDQQPPPYPEMSTTQHFPQDEKKQQDQQQQEQQHFPPPPPLPQPQEEKPKQVSPPPESPHQQQQQAFPPPPPLPQVQVDKKEQQFPPPPASPYQQQQQQYPPPPPLPHQQQQTLPLHPQTQPQYSIPAYNPASPVFAPSPTDPQPLKQGHFDHHQAQQSAPSPSSPHGDSTSHGRPKHSWGERFSQLGMKAASPINSLAHKLGSQSFLPETMDKECDKAAAILKAFCKKGVYTEPGAPDVNAPSPTQGHTPESQKGENNGSSAIDPTTRKPRNRVLVTIPPKVISKAVGLAIFTTLRAGYGVSGATGSGVLVARLPDGTWSPPSGIQLHSLGGGFQIGLDIYDCVCVINSQKALEAFMDTRVSLGSDLAVVAGPYGAGAGVDFAVPESKPAKKGVLSSPPAGSSAGAKDESSPPRQEKASQQEQQNLQPPNDGANDKSKKGRGLSGSVAKPVFSYVKSRGLYAGVSVDGTVVAERKDANASFYGQSISVHKILRGQVPPHGPSGGWPAGAQNLFAVLKGAEAGAQTGAPTSPSRPGQGLGDFYSRDQDDAGAPPPEYQDDGRHPMMQDVKYR